MRYGTRGHDIAANTPETLCASLNALGISEIQLVAHKSFPGFRYCEESIRELAECFARHGIRVAVYGCYIDPLTQEGQQRFLEHIRYAKLLNAGAIATESAVGVTALQKDEKAYAALVEAFRTFAEAGAAEGVRVAVETVSVHPICDAQKTKRLLDDVGSDNLYVILDPKNLMHHENDPHTVELAEEAIRLYGDRIAAAHWKEPDAPKDHPVIEFVKNRKETVLITEGLSGEDLAGFIRKIKKEN